VATRDDKGRCEERPVARAILGVHPPEEAAGNKSLERQRRLAQRVTGSGQELVAARDTDESRHLVAQLSIPEDVRLAPRAAQQVLRVAPGRTSIGP
jgi:hypothetical protein